MRAQASLRRRPDTIRCRTSCRTQVGDYCAGLVMLQGHGQAWPTHACRSPASRSPVPTPSQAQAQKPLAAAKLPASRIQLLHAPVCLPQEPAT